MKKFKGLTSAEVQASKNAHGDNRLSSKAVSYTHLQKQP